MSKTLGIIVFGSISSLVAASDPCMQMCIDLGDKTACAGSGKGSYCKGWQKEQPVCQGFIRRKDETLCFLTGGPDDVNCSGDPVACPIVRSTTESPPTPCSTTQMPNTTGSPVTTTTAEPCTTTNTAEPCTTTTTAEPCTTTTTTMAPFHTTTKTTGAPCTTTTKTTGAPCTTTTTSARRTTIASTTKRTTTSSTTTTIKTSTSTSTTTKCPTLEGHFCGKLMFHSFDIILKNGRLTLNLPSFQVEGSCDYHVSGSSIDLSHFDDVLKAVMAKASIKKFDITIIDSNQIRLKAGVFLRTTLKRC
ncbi:hypothetical protein FOZ60_004198 [Perkinsus olseni]|uniref:Uncharacterized protein n=1 Tax=Perkinsus olseni TaxID=32597 RepID=A0A7J6NUI2_PEROL|nr:hypothetical protein FOZ60_004198 [Perkinsus olseni]